MQLDRFLSHERRSPRKAISYLLFSWLVLDVIRGWTSLLGVISLFAGIQLMVMGIMAEYVARLYEQSQGRPLFVIQDMLRTRAGKP
jgi:dolichol-phosphate mannosyltransferase